MAGMDQLSPWWSAARHADRKPLLLARAAITRAVRAFFDEQDFTEVETGILQVSPGNEIHLHAPRTELTCDDGTQATRYLRTSPEFAAKKLLAAGEAKIFEFARVFRDRERGDLHLPEFTMLEWYRANAGYDAVMADSVVGLPRAESDQTIEELCQASERPAHIYEHVWRAGDLLIWDNRCTLHARTDFDPAERRVLRRMAIRGQRPIPAVAAA